jgi:rubrerythrin
MSSFQRIYAEMLFDEDRRAKYARLRLKHAAHVKEKGLACRDTNYVGENQFPGWECPHCGFAPWKPAYS